MDTSSEYRRQAMEALQNRWGTAILVTLVAMLMGGGAAAPPVSRNFDIIQVLSRTTSPAISRYSDIIQGLSERFLANPFIFFLLQIILFATPIYITLFFIFGGSVSVGLRLYNIRLLSDQEQRPFTTLFEPFHYFGKAFLLRIYTSFFIFLWSLLLVIPGIIAEYRYSMAGYILAENPELSVSEAVNRSKEMMQGVKGDFFVLRLSFLGWVFLSVFTLGIGSLWLNPYIGAAEAAFYLDLRSE